MYCHIEIDQDTNIRLVDDSSFRIKEFSNIRHYEDTVTYFSKVTRLGLDDDSLKMMITADTFNPRSKIYRIIIFQEEENYIDEYLGFDYDKAFKIINKLIESGFKCSNGFNISNIEKTGSLFI